MKVQIACSTRSRLKGLFKMDERSEVLLLVPCNDVHTFGMRRLIDVAFLSSNGCVIKAYREVGPRRRLRCKEAVATLERFSSEDLWYEQGNQVELDCCIRAMKKQES